jgi:hypothetical protein
VLDTADNSAPATRQAFKIETFLDRDNWMRDMLASDLGYRAKIVATRLALYLHAESGRCIVSIPTLAISTGLSKNTVRDAIDDLEATRWMGITRSRGGRSIDGVGYAHVFRLLHPNGSTACTVGEGATVQNEGGNGSKLKGVTVQNEPTNGSTGWTLTERTEKRTERTAKVAFTRSGHDQNRPKQGNQQLTMWPADLILNKELISFATSKGFNPDRARTIFDKFKYHHQAKGSRLADWTAAWRGWVVEQVDRDAKARSQTVWRDDFIDGRL